jgi:hypothetical protein
MSKHVQTYKHNVKILAHPMRCLTALKTRGKKGCTEHMKCVSLLSTTLVPINIRRVTPEMYAKPHINPHVTFVTLVQLKKIGPISTNFNKTSKYQLYENPFMHFSDCYLQTWRSKVPLFNLSLPKRQKKVAIHIWYLNFNTVMVITKRYFH